MRIWPASASHDVSTSSGYKLLSVLQLVSEGHKPAWTAEELAGVLGISLSTCYRYLKLLVEAQLLDHGSSGYVIGPGVVALYRQLQLHDPVLRAARNSWPPPGSAPPSFYAACSATR